MVNGVQFVTTILTLGALYRGKAECNIRKKL